MQNVIPFVPFFLKISNQGPIVILGLEALLVGFFLSRFISYIGYLFYGIFLFQILWALYDYTRYNLLKGKETIPEYNEKMTNVESMKIRRSNRAFQRRYLTSDHEMFVKKLLEKSKKPKDVRVVYIKHGFKRCTFITDCYQFVIVIIPKKFNDHHILSVGNYVENLILRMTKKGIATCWVGGFRGNEVTGVIKGKDFNEKTDHVAILVAMGYKSMYWPIAIRVSYGVSIQRIPPESLFFDEEYGNPLEIEKLGEKMFQVFDCTRWSPTASNAQDVRILRKGKRHFHFFKVGESNYYSVMNCGIWMRNWEVACLELGIGGHFIKSNDPNLLDGFPPSSKYFFTWEMLEQT